ncbi:hypothetical protein MN608_00991 [Microdochium nivale]|nr:hypothetical protein MN608_00991 [Microdochium nivale]
MPPKKETSAAANGEASALSAREFAILSSYLKTLPASAKAAGNWETVASDTGLGSEKSARDALSRLCKKNGWFGAGETSSNGDAAATTAKTPVKTPKKRGTPKGKKVDKEADSDGVPETPTKKQKVCTQSQDGDADLDEFINMNALAE